MSTLTKMNDHARSVALQLRSLLPTKKPTVLYDVPYTSQFASPDFVEQVLIQGVPAAEDTKWPTTGAKTADEYVTWVTTICGMACTNMALQYFFQQNLPIVTLALDAQKHGVYQNHNGHLSGMRYHEYVDWVRSYGLEGSLYRNLNIQGIRYLLASGALVIASVNPNIRGIATVSPTQIGGHLVLVVGYDISAGTVTIHNPSGFVSNQSYRFHTLSTTEFKQYFASRGISLSPIAQ